MWEAQAQSQTKVVKRGITKPDPKRQNPTITMSPQRPKVTAIAKIKSDQKRAPSHRKTSHRKTNRTWDRADQGPSRAPRIAERTTRATNPRRELVVRKMKIQKARKTAMAVSQEPKRTAQADRPRTREKTRLQIPAGKAIHRSNLVPKAQRKSQVRQTDQVRRAQIILRKCLKPTPQTPTRIQRVVQTQVIPHTKAMSLKRFLKNCNQSKTNRMNRLLTPTIKGTRIQEMKIVEREPIKMPKVPAIRKIKVPTIRQTVGPQKIK